jgi:PPM family protein phosphatase
MPRRELKPTADAAVVPPEPAVPSEPAAPAGLEASYISDCGKVRPTNEDSVCVVIPDDPALLREKGALMAVADGMGGHEAGEIASRIAIDRVRAAYYTASAPPHEALPEAVRAANLAVLEHARRNPHLAGMGTTCTAVAVAGGAAWLAHVGDSRLYLVRGGAAYRMTQDHSAAMELVARGLLTLAEADHHEQRNVIVRAVGTHARVEVTTWKDPFPLRPGDWLVLSTDGMHETIRDEEIGEIAGRAADCADACQLLLRLALERDGSDNITVAVLRVPRRPEETAQ